MADEKPPRSIDERIDAVVMTLELMSHDLQDLKSTVQQLAVASQADAENIRALARIAELHSSRMDDHQHRIEDLEGQQ